MSRELCCETVFSSNPSPFLVKWLGSFAFSFIMMLDQAPYSDCFGALKHANLIDTGMDNNEITEFNNEIIDFFSRRFIVPLLWLSTQTSMITQ